MARAASFREQQAVKGEIDSWSTFYFTPKKGFLFCAKRKINLSRMIFRLAEIDFSFSGDFFVHFNQLKTNAMQNATFLSEILISRIPCEVYVRQVYPFPLGVKTKAGRKVLWTLCLPYPSLTEYFLMKFRRLLFASGFPEVFFFLDFCFLSLIFGIGLFVLCILALYFLNLLFQTIGRT